LTFGGAWEADVLGAIFGIVLISSLTGAMPTGGRKRSWRTLSGSDLGPAQVFVAPARLGAF